MLTTKSGRGPEELDGCETWEELSSYKMRSSVGAGAGGPSTGGATTGAGASMRCCKRVGAAAEYCIGAGAAAEYCTVVEECVVGSTAPVRRGDGATGAGPAEVYCKGAGAAAEYCTAAEECVVGSTAPVRWGGGATEARPAEVYLLYRGRGRSGVLYSSGGVCGGVHSTRPSEGRSYRG